MIVQRYIDINGRSYTYTESDAGKYIQRDNIVVEYAYDPTEFNRVYTEGDLIPTDDLDDFEALNILLGGES